MSKKIIVVGGVAGGASAAARIRRIDEQAQITVYEKGRDSSYSNCSLPFLLSGTVESASKLVMVTPDDFKHKYNIQMRTRHEVLSIDREKKEVLVRNLTDGTEFVDAYDQLILSPGAKPFVPKLEGLETNHIFTVKDVTDISRLDSFIREQQPETVAVVGGGFIGLEIAENLCLAGRKVTLVEALPQVMAPLDEDMAQILHKALYDHGISLVLGDGLKRICEDGLELASGKFVEAGAVVMALGVRAETELAVNAGLELGETGNIRVNAHYQTSDPDIYAVGDAIEVPNLLTGRQMRLTQAGPAQKEARAAADHIYGISHGPQQYMGSAVIRVFEWTAAVTGLNEKTARAAGIDYDFIYIIPNDRVGLMPNVSPVHFKLLYEKSSGKVLGAQAVSRGNADKRIDVVATLIAMNGTLEDLANLELCYAPAYGTAKDVVNYGAMVALNIKNGVYRQVPVTAVRSLVEEKAFIVDVREANEYAEGHIIGAINIPLSQLRERAGEIPKDKPVYLHCRTGQRSYNALMALKGMDYENLYNVSGSFLGLSYYEYYHDMASGRDKIVTDYNFN